MAPQTWLCSRILLAWIFSTFKIYHREQCAYNSEGCQPIIWGSKLHFSALEPRELKVLKLLEQNQAYLPKLITLGTQVNHLLRPGCFLPGTEDPQSLLPTETLYGIQTGNLGTLLWSYSPYFLLTRLSFHPTQSSKCPKVPLSSVINKYKQDSYTNLIPDFTSGTRAVALEIASPVTGGL